jgi:hypothetical protein
MKEDSCGLRQADSKIAVRIPEHFSPEQALALWEFLQELSQTLWDRYEVQLVQLIRAQIQAESSELEDLSDFDDEIPF